MLETDERDLLEMGLSRQDAHDQWLLQVNTDTQSQEH